MTSVTLFCAEPPQLSLGPSAVPGECIQFKDGFAVVDTAQFPDWEQWVAHPGTPLIEVLPSDSEQVPASAGAFVCPVCTKSFTSRIAVTGHLRSHAPKE